MKGYGANIEALALENSDFRRVLYTGRYSQLVLMSLQPSEEIGMETHDDVDQFFRFEQGSGTVVIDGLERSVGDGDVAIVPAGAEHNVINASPSEPLKLYTIYSPPEHRDGVVRATKEDAESESEHFDGVTSE